MKVFIVTSGTYSDYGIRAVFADIDEAKAKKQAEDFVEFSTRKDEYNQYYIEDWESSEFIPQVPPNKKYYQVVMDMNNGIAREPQEMPLLQESGEIQKQYWHVYNPKLRQYSNPRNDVIVYVYARDEKHAVKITSEIRREILAGNKPEVGNL